MDNLLLVNHTEEVTRIAVIENGNLSEVNFETATERRIVGNIYKGKVLRVLPGMNAAFVDVGLERTAFLYAYDIVSTQAPAEEASETPDDPSEDREKDEVSIARLVHEGQEILVQISKEPIGSKGARLTCNIALPGVFAVFLPTTDHVGISRKIDDPDERDRLKEIGERFRPPGTGVILRTIAEGRPADEIAGEMDFLYKLWNQIQQGGAALDAPALVHRDLDLLLRTARDLVCRRFDKLIIDSEEGARAVENFVKRFLPGAAASIEVYDDKEPLFDRHRIEYEIARALQRKVWLKSGGYLIIERAEAFAAIDVNSGKYTGKSDPEETILKTNLEAAREIAYQLRLRDIGGIFVIDFIDMRDRENRRKVEETLAEEMKADHSRARILPMSELGLIEMTRKRVSESVVKRLTEPCFYCEGKGFLKSPTMISHYMFEKISKEVKKRQARNIHVHANPNVISKLMELYGPGLENLEKTYHRGVVITERDNFHIEHFEIFGQGD